MTDHLQRLISSSAPPQDTGWLHPVVRSQSPIAETDQRLGLASFDNLTVSDGIQPSTMTSALTADSEITATRPSTTPPFIQRKLLSSVSAVPGSALSSEATSARSPLAFPLTTNRQKAMTPPHQTDNKPAMARSQASTTTNISTRRRRTTEKSETTAQSTNQASFEKTADGLPEFTEQVIRPGDDVSMGTQEPAHIGNNFGTSSAINASELDQQTTRNSSILSPRGFLSHLDQSASSFVIEKKQNILLGNHHLEQMKTDTSFSFDTAHTPISLEPAPRDEWQLNNNETKASQPFTQDARPETTPRVVIGRINVEVILPPPEARIMGAPVNPQPLSAASVSKIGPLRTRMRSNLIYNLRQR